MATHDEYGSINMQPFNIPCTPLNPTPTDPTSSRPHDRMHSESTPILTPNQRSNSVKHRGCCATLWRWTLSYWKRQLNHVPIFYFAICLLLTPIVALVGFVEGGITFYVTGTLTLTMCAYATYKFKTYGALHLKSAVTTFRRNNLEMRVQLKLLENQISVMKTQKIVLEDSAVSLEEVNMKNEQNLEKFQDIEQRMEMAGAQSKTSMSALLKRTAALNKEWTDMWLIKQQNMFQALYDCFEQTRSESPSRGCNGLRRGFYQKFKHSLPRWHRARFLEQSQLDQLFETESIVCFETFCNALDLFGTYMLILLVIY